MIYWIQEATEAGAQGAASSWPSAILAPVLAALIGDILGSTATNLWQVRRENKQRVRERIGTLRLLDKEVERNQKRIDPVAKGTHGRSPNPHEHVPATNVWDKVNVRLAQPLEDDDLFADLVKYYEIAHDLGKFVQDSSAPAQSKLNRMSIRSRRLIALSKNVRPRLQELIGKTKLKGGRDAQD